MMKLIHQNKLKYLFYSYFRNMINPQSNIFLIADPFLKDNSFMRSVVYLCNHNNEGSYGFILNKRTDYFLNDLIPEIKNANQIPIFSGGTVGIDSIHFLHQLPHLIPDGLQLNEELFWGGDFNILKSNLSDSKVNLNKIKFFIGYSGWSAGQLNTELEEKSWLTSPADNDIIFNTLDEILWRKSVRLLGPGFEEIINYPLDPELN